MLKFGTPLEHFILSLPKKQKQKPYIKYQRLTFVVLFYIEGFFVIHWKLSVCGILLRLTLVELCCHYQGSHQKYSD